MMKYDFISLPVVDKEGRLVGIVTVDDVMDVMEEEATEDFEKMAAMAPSEKPLPQDQRALPSQAPHSVAAGADDLRHDHRRHPGSL